jgi:hypothetical protein
LKAAKLKTTMTDPPCNAGVSWFAGASPSDVAAGTTTTLERECHRRIPHMKTMYRIWWLILGIGITVLGGYLTAVDPTMRVTGLIAIVVGIAVSCVMGYVLYGEFRG